MSILKSILLKTGAILVVCLTLAALSAIFITSKNATAQIELDSLKSLNQLCIQIDFMMDEVKQSTKSILSDEAVQDYLFSENADIEKALYQMKSYKLQRDYIHSVAAVSMDGKVLWDEIEAEPQYFEVYMNESWYQDVIDWEKPVYTVEHPIFNRTGFSVANVISYVQPVYSMNNTTMAGGKVIVNIKSDHFWNAVESSSMVFDEIMLLNGNGQEMVHVWNQEKVLEAEMSQNLAEGINPSDGDDTILCQNLASGYGRLLVRYPVRSMTSRLGYQNVQYILFVIVALLIAGIGIIIPSAINIIRPLKVLLNKMETIASGNYTDQDVENLPVLQDVSTIKDEVILLDNQFNIMMHALDAQVKRNMEASKTMQKLQLELLVSQINPHFLYNTLNTVIFLSRRYHVEDIENITESLISLLQDTLQTEGDMYFSLLGKEMHMIDCYANIQSYRYASNFKLEWNIPEPLKEARIPRLLLQPLVENALFHGIQPKGEPGTILIEAYQEDQYLVITVVDDGVGMEESRLKQIGLQENQEHSVGSFIRNPIGIRNIYKRLETLYGKTAEIHFESVVSQGTTVTIILPLEWGKRDSGQNNI